MADTMEQCLKEEADTSMTEEYHHKKNILQRGTLESDDVVISGVSCRLPESDNMAEFRQHLINKDDMVTGGCRRWPKGLYGLPVRSGKLKDISKFDASFFDVHPKQADAMAPELRMLIEITYEAMIDAGINPNTLKGTRTGVYIGAGHSESHDAWSHDLETTRGYTMTGCQRGMLANRLSFVFDFKGPSVVLDAACASGLLALNQAFHDIRQGQCDTAIVGGVNLCQNPLIALQFQKLGVLSQDGTCKSFDASGDGYCRSEGVVAMFVQKRKGAKRIYATVVNAKTNNDGRKEKGITFPSSQDQINLLQEVYNEAGIDPSTVEYVEAHGTGTSAGDTIELDTINTVFCTNRKAPLLVGSVKSNMGHSESTSGLASVCKCIIGTEDNMMPANLHFNKPRSDTSGLFEKNLQVVTKRAQLNGGLIAVNSFGFGGSNVHVILQQNTETKSISTVDKSKRLFVYSSRTEGGVKQILNAAIENAGNLHFHFLINESSDCQQGYRGYTVLNSESRLSEIQAFSRTYKRPVWYVFNGMGSQWCGMGQQMMSIPKFRSSIVKCDDTLRQYGIVLSKLLTEGTQHDFSDVVNSFVGIAAIQIGIVDLLKSMRILPNGLIGHSVGELGCGYADGSLTLEETILAAYWRGRCIKDANLPPGSMAVVGLSWQDAKALCPDGVEPACHNSTDTVTISGPSAEVDRFVQHLQDKQIFAKTVETSGVAFHSKYMQKPSIALLSVLKKVIVPKQRGKQWISTSIPESEWDSERANTSSAEYHVNNLTSPVLFEEALHHVPNHAIVIEIGPHCLLQSILKRSLGSLCTITGLMKKHHHDNVEYFLQGVGKCFLQGMNIDPLKMCKSVTLPVPRGTPMISPLISWDHSGSWNYAKVEDFLKDSKGKHNGFIYEIDMKKGQNQFLKDHSIDGRILYPVTGFLVFAWKSFAKLKGLKYEDLPVNFKNVVVRRATILQDEGLITFIVNISEVTGMFDITESNSVVCQGLITSPKSQLIPSTCNKAMERTLSSEDLYKELRLRGLYYGPKFRGIIWTTDSVDTGELHWDENWVTFIDSMLQMYILCVFEEKLRLPTKISSVTIDPHVHRSTERSEKTAIVNKHLRKCSSGGVEIVGVATAITPRQHHGDRLFLQKYCFVPYIADVKCREETLIYLRECSNYCAQELRSLSQSDKVSCKEKEIISHLNDVSADTDLLPSIPSDLIDDILAQKLKTQFSSQSNSVHSALEVNKLGTRYNLMHCQEILKVCLDIVIENANENHLRILEIGASNSRMHDYVHQCIDSDRTITVDYIEADYPGTRNAENIPDKIKHVDWCVMADITNLDKVDLVIVKNFLHNENNVSLALSNISTVLKPNGFILAEEITTNFPVAYSVEYLGRNGPSIQDEQDRTHYCYCDEKKWSEIFYGGGYEIAFKRSSRVLSTLLLTRKISPEVYSQQVVSMDDINGSWFGILKRALLERKDGPVWLTALNEQNSGLLGFFNCLKKEPDMENLRCIFNMDKNGFDLAPDSEEFAKLVSKDLKMNVYNNGQWGSFRHIPISGGKISQRNIAFIVVPHLEVSNNEKIIYTSKEVQDEYVCLKGKKCSHAHVDIATKGDLSSLTWVESPVPNVEPERNCQICRVSYAALNFRDIMVATGRLPVDALPKALEVEDCVLGMEFSGHNATGQRTMGLVSSKGIATTVKVRKGCLWNVPNTWTLEEAATVPLAYFTAIYSLVVRGKIKRGDRVLIHSGSGGVGQAAITIALSHGCEVYTTVGSLQKRQFLMEKFPELKHNNISDSRSNKFSEDIMLATDGKGLNVVLNSLSEEKLEESLKLLARHGRFLEIGKFDMANNRHLEMSIFLKNISFHGILVDAILDEDSNDDMIDVSRLLKQGIESGVIQPLKSTVFDRMHVEDAFRFMAQGKHIGKVLIKVSDNPESGDIQTIPAVTKSFCNNSNSYIITGGLGEFGLELAEWLIERGARRLVLTSRSGVQTGYQAKKIEKFRGKGVNLLVTSLDVSIEDEARQLIERSNKLGPIGGIFHLAMVLRDRLFKNMTEEDFHAVCKPKITGTINLDSLSRRYCTNSLEWFVVFSSISCAKGNAGQSNYGYANSAMERICEKRIQDRCPGLAIQWGPIGDVGVLAEKDLGGCCPQKIPSCLAVLDQCLNQSNSVVFSFVTTEMTLEKKYKSMKRKMTEDVYHILGVKYNSSINHNTSFGNLGLDSLMGVEMQQVFDKKYGITFSMDQIRNLTISKVQEMESSNKKSSWTQKRDNMDNVGHFVSINTFGLNCCVPEIVCRQLTCNVGIKNMFLIHSLAGNVSCFKDLSSYLTCTVYGLQCTADTPLDSISSMASYYIEHMRNVQKGGPYLVAGYSFGAAVAMEITLQLQETDTIGHLYLLEGSHLTVKERFELHCDIKQLSTIAEKESEVLALFVGVLIPDKYNITYQLNLNQPDFKSRLSQSTDILMESNLFKSRDDVIMAARLFYRRVIIGTEYSFEGHIHCDVTLIKAFESSGFIGNDLELKQSCDREITMHTVPGNHETFLMGDNASEVAALME